MKNLIEVKYQYAKFPNVVLRKFFKTQEQINIFKQQHSDYIYIN
jgi:hypothetical protein